MSRAPDDSIAADGAEDEPSPRAAAAPVLGYEGRRQGMGRVWPWVRPGTVGFIVILASAAAGLWWGVWTWRVAEDRKAFAACTTILNVGGGTTDVEFTHAPTRSALRHLSRLPGPVIVWMYWPAAEDPGAAEAFRSAELGNVTGIRIRGEVNADLLLKELSRPDCGLKALTDLYLGGTQVTDAGLKELSRPDCGLKALTGLYLNDTKVTDVGLKELSRPDCGLKALTVLWLVGTQVTDAGLKELSRPDCGLKALTGLYLNDTKVTDAGVKELQTARPGLTIRR